MNDDRVFVVSKENSKQFLEDSKKNVIPPEFLKKCLASAKLLNKKHRIISTEKSLKDIIPINWSEDVLSGKKKVEVKHEQH